MLRSVEYVEIKSDYDRISRAHFARNYFYPEGVRFAVSDALFPPGDLAAIVGAEYNAQCRMLCYRTAPSWNEVLDRFRKLRELL